jgi:hypothetical protein
VFLCSTFALLACSLSPAMATTYTWNDSSGGNWNVASNWGGGVPGGSDTANLGAQTGNYTVLLSDTESINTLNVNYTGATLNVGGTLTVNGSANITAGAFNMFGTLVLNGSLTTAAAATSAWSAGTLQGGGTLYGTLNVTGGVAISSNTLNNGGTLAFASGSSLVATYGTSDSLTNQVGAVINFLLTNTSTGVINFQADGAAFTVTSQSSGVLVNQGTLLKSVGTSTGTSIAWNVDFQNGGTIRPCFKRPRKPWENRQKHAF